MNLEGTHCRARMSKLSRYKVPLDYQRYRPFEIARAYWLPSNKLYLQSAVTTAVRDPQLPFYAKHNVRESISTLMDPLRVRQGSLQVRSAS